MPPPAPGCVVRAPLRGRHTHVWLSRRTARKTRQHGTFHVDGHTPSPRDHVARSATVTGTLAARTAGMSPLMRPIPSAQPNPNRARAGVTAI